MTARFSSRPNLIFGVNFDALGMTYCFHNLSELKRKVFFLTFTISFEHFSDSLSICCYAIFETDFPSILRPYISILR